MIMTARFRFRRLLLDDAEQKIDLHYLYLLLNCVSVQSVGVRLKMCKLRSVWVRRSNDQRLVDFRFDFRVALWSMTPTVEGTQFQYFVNNSTNQFTECRFHFS